MNHLIHSYYAMSTLALKKLRKKTPVEKLNKTKKKLSRFDGLSEEEVQKCTLPDYLEMNLDIVFVGINPGLMAAHRGRYYAGPGNHFYKLLHESGLTPQCLNYEEDYKLLQYGIGLTNIVERATRSSADLKRIEIKEGSKILKEKLEYFKPKIAVFNGKQIYEVFANKTSEFNFGLQSEYIGNIVLWVTPSSSARCANFPRMTDKLLYYTALYKYLQYLKGQIKEINMQDFIFEGKCKQFNPCTSKMWRRKNISAFLHGGRIANKDTIGLDTSAENIAMVNSTEFIVKYTFSDKSKQLKKMSDTNDNEIESVSQQNIKVFHENDISLQNACSEFVNDTKNNLNLNKIQNAEEITEFTGTTTEVLSNNNGRKQNNMKLHQKLTRTNFINNSNSEFFNLIKNRLKDKVNLESQDTKDAE